MPPLKIFLAYPHPLLGFKMYETGLQEATTYLKVRQLADARYKSIIRFETDLWGRTSSSVMDSGLWVLSGDPSL